MSAGLRFETIEPSLELSVVVAAHDMARELPRTLRSMSPTYQTGISRDAYEIIVVDNGSRDPVTTREFDELGIDVRLIRIDSPSPSPVVAMNTGIRSARGRLVAAHIDGARILSPGVLAGALRARRLADRPVIAVCGFHLGRQPQQQSVASGYDSKVEDLLLQAIRWPEDGYRLFEVAVFASSSRDGWFSPMTESNCLFLSRETWSVLGGFDERFTTPGGGYCNLDLFERACAQESSRLIVLLGEGTFHQVHGGVATNRSEPPVAAFVAEYAAIRGRPPGCPPHVETLYLGRAPAPSTLAIGSARPASASSRLRRRWLPRFGGSRDSDPGG